MLRLTKDGKRKYLSLHLSLNPIHWDFSKNKPKRNCPERERITDLIEQKTQVYRKQIIEYASQERDYTLNTLVQKVENPIVRQTFGEYLDNYIKSLRAEKRLGYAKTFKELESSLSRHLQSLDFYFNDIDIAWLRGYELHLRNRGNSENTIGIRFRSLRVLYNRAMEENLVKRTNYPFTTFKVSKFHEETSKRAISKEDIRRIIAFDMENLTGYHSPYLHLSKNIFLFSYLGCGMNLTDIVNLRYCDIFDRRVTYHRQKTGKLISFQLQSLAQDIIAKYHSTDRGPKDYVFPVLNKDKHTTPEQRMERVKKANKAINKKLRKLGETLELPIDLTIYVARHTYATVLKRSGVSTAIISESLGHSSEKITQIYLDSFENSQIDEAMENLL